MRPLQPFKYHICSALRYNTEAPALRAPSYVLTQQDVHCRDRARAEPTA